MLESVYGHLRDLDYLKQIETPPKTKTFSPISHFDFVNLIQETSVKCLSPHGFQLGDTRVLTSGNDKRIFGTMAFQKPNESSQNPLISMISLSVGFRQSTDKTMAAAFAIGGQVNVCSNGMFSGDEVVFRRHTGDIENVLKEKLIVGLHDADKDYEKVLNTAYQLQSKHLSDDEAYSYFGKAYGRKILSPNQFTVAVKEWEEPSYDHGEKTAWRWYNAMTQSFKMVPHNTTIKRHIELHKFCAEPFSLN